MRRKRKSLAEPRKEKAKNNKKKYAKNNSAQTEKGYKQKAWRALFERTKLKIKNQKHKRLRSGAVSNYKIETAPFGDRQIRARSVAFRGVGRTKVRRAPKTAVEKVHQN